ncbi:MAG: PH domain-containing protein [Candidatus Diapherotrites archaeon]
MDEASAKFELKPNKTAFVYFRFIMGLVGGLIGLVIASIIVTLFFGPIAVLAIGVFVFLLIAKSAISFISLTVQYRKTRYLFFENKIITKTGGILSERETEMVIRNITHVTLIKPFIENKIFKTANILVELAGSANVEGLLFSIDKPDELYQGILEIMQVNGFSLLKGTLVQKEKPSKIGIVMEIMGMGFGLFFLGIYIGLPLISFLASVGGIVLLLAGFALLAIAFLAFAFIRFMNLLMRTYYIYDDTIVYNEGFLTKVNSFIPIENLADSEITQSLWDKIFGLYDVKISCQGATHEILFKNMKNGAQMEKSIDGLIAKSKSLVGTGKKVGTVKGEVAEKKIAPGKAAVVNMDESFTAKYKMDFMKSFIGPLGGAIIMFLILAIPTLGLTLILIPLSFIFIAIPILITVSATTFQVKPKSMEQRFNFLNSRNVEFTNDKITGVLIVRDILDEFFKTMSIQFWSIGATHNINFSNIKRTPDLAGNILGKFGMTEQEPIYSVGSNFGIIAMLKSHLFVPLLAIVGLAATGIILLALPGLEFFGIISIIISIAILIIYAGLVIYKYMFYKTTKLEIYKNYVHYCEGIFNKKYYYSLYDNIKDIKTVQIPFSDLGTIVFNVAGEMIVGQAKGGGLQNMPGGGGRPNAMQGMLASHNFKINFVQGISTKDDLIDMIFHKRLTAAQIKSMEANIKESDSENLAIAKPAVANTLLPLIVIMLVVNTVIVLLIVAISPILIIPLVLIDLLIFAYAVGSVLVTSYAIQPYRVVAKSGILFKTQTSIIFGKIDHLRSSEGWMNKLFRNGNITVHTTGSSLPEITIKDIPAYREFYQKLEKYY